MAYVNAHNKVGYHCCLTSDIPRFAVGFIISCREMSASLWLHTKSQQDGVFPIRYSYTNFICLINVALCCREARPPSFSPHQLCTDGHEVDKKADLILHSLNHGALREQNLLCFRVLRYAHALHRGEGTSGFCYFCTNNNSSQ
jgi:hypothetical protein